MMVLSFRDTLVDKVRPLITYKPTDTSVYVVGSLSTLRQATYNQNLSDIDLLIVPICDSLKDFVSHFEQAIRVSKYLNSQEGWVVDVFLMRGRIAEKYFKLLPVIAGGRVLAAEDLLLGGVIKSEAGVAYPSEQTRKHLYAAKAGKFIHDYIDLLPVADTSQARLVSKRILKGLSLVVCSRSTTDELTNVEESVMKNLTFANLNSLMKQTLNVEIPYYTFFQKILDGNSVDDWPSWMVAQDLIARLLIELRDNQKVNVNDERLYDGLADVRDLLNTGLKNVIAKLGSGVDSVEEYADASIHATVELALSGVKDLEDLESEATPALVRESYTILVKHLQGEDCSHYCLAAAVIILEYAMECGILYLNQISGD